MFSDRGKRLMIFMRRFHSLALIVAFDGVRFVLLLLLLLLLRLLLLLPPPLLLLLLLLG